MAPNVKESNIRVVFGNEFFTPQLILTSGLNNACLFYDNFHLELNEEKKLGPHVFKKAKSLLRSLKTAISPEMFEKYRSALLIKFAGDGKVLNPVNKYTVLKQFIATYIIDSTTGSFQRRGSSPAKQSHSSIVSFIGKEFTGEFDKLLLILLKRHHHKCLKTNELSTNGTHGLRLKEHILDRDDPGSEEAKAVGVLNL